jgi:Xaa-Pro aminopeptidase
MPTPYKQRIARLKSQLQRQGLRALLVTNPLNWFYLTGFRGESGILLVEPDELTLITDGRFTVQAKQEAPSLSIVPQKDGLYRTCGELLRRQKRRQVGFDSAQMTVAQFGALRKATGGSVRLREAPGVVEALRGVKDAQELAQMRQAAVLASEVVEAAIRLLKPGIREFEVAAEIEYQTRRRGASGTAFETIVAFGERAALPHARPTAKRLKRGQLVVLDLGAILEKYCSDITRTVFVGKAPEKVKAWYRAVAEAQRAAIEKVAAGRACGEVDAAARGVLAAHRLDPFFVHSTGHGLGLEVHEDPRVAKGQKTLLASGNVVTIEPGVYVPGVGGIRIEDDVVVGKSGNEVLTRASRDFIEL